MKAIRNIVLGLVGAGVVLALLIQLVPYGRNHTNPPIIAEPQWDSPQTRALFMTTCGDCHSNETKWPWYSNIAPVSWLVYHDIAEGREYFNVSEWGRGENEADEAAETLLEGEMPLAPYLLLHPEAKLSPGDRQALAQGLSATFGGESGLSSADD